MSGKARFIALAALVAAAAAAARFTPLGVWLEKDNLLRWLEALDDRWWGPAVFVLVYGIGSACALPGTPLTLAGGAVFGTAKGTLCNVIASNLGATLAFWTARTLGRDFVAGLMKGGRLARFDETAAKNGFLTILRLRLIPAVPFNGLNFGAGFSGIRFSDYFWGSLLGMLPATFVYTAFADALVQGARGAGRRAFVNAAVAGAALIVLSFLPALARGRRRAKGE